MSLTVWRHPAYSIIGAYVELKYRTSVSPWLPGGAPVHGAAILHCQYSPDGTRLVTASVDKTARVLRLPLARHGGDGTDLIGHAGAVGGAAWSHDGGLVVGMHP
jgi:WD40 repeat protein